MSTLVLVLNTNFEPINVCNLQRAIGLMVSRKASLVSNGRGEIHSASLAYPIPSVIRLDNMIYRPRPRVKLTRREIFRRDNYTCQYCGKRAASLTVDHILPRHLGGKEVWTNLVTACSSCNHLKGGHTLEEAKMRLLHLPKEPPASTLYIFGRHLNENQEWMPFLTGW
ncbi:MAG TPA: HNH endonuclease [Longilinea sp.]|nr:HNH endonuclease [Longilinea sp.]